jgi:4-amino-4-deoxy-L-arabinose transferase-like glycosyltransferase
MSARKILLLVLLTALALRTIAAVGLTARLKDQDRSFLIEGDAAGYWELGEHMAAGEAYELHGRPGDPLAAASIPRQVTRMPGFPALLGLVIRLGGDSLLVTRVVLAMIGTLGCYLVYLLGCRIFTPQVGLAAAAACAISPTLVGFSVLVLSETLFAVLMLACLLGTVSLLRPDADLDQRPRPGIAAWTGLAGCAAVYVRPGWLAALPLLGLMAIVLSEHRRRSAIEAGVLLLVVALGLLPWAWRNLQVTSHPVLTTLWVGPTLYDGLREGATGESDMQFIIDDGLFADPRQTEFQIDRHYRLEAWDFVRTQPLEAGRLALVKCWRYLKPWPSAPEFQGAWQIAVVAVPTLLLYLLALKGAWAYRYQPWTWMLVAFPLLYFAALHTVFVGSLRYRVPAEYPLWILAAAGFRRRSTT